MTGLFRRHAFVMAAVLVLAAGGWRIRGAESQGKQTSTWKLGAPIVTYYVGPTLTDAVAEQMAEGGWNLVWCDNEAELDIAQRHGLRAQFPSSWRVFRAMSDDVAQQERFKALIDRISKHPALYQYFVRDEPAATEFPAIGRLVADLRQRDPKHLSYINLFPNWCSDEQLETKTKGDYVALYREYLRQYMNVVKPSLLSWDHYPFATAGDNFSRYFANLADCRQVALGAGVPFMTCAQAASWGPDVRVPNGDEMRLSIYSTLAYGAQGISYYVYRCPDHKGGIALADGTPTPIYHALKTLNLEFVAIATELQPLRSLAVYHTGMAFPGTTALPNDASFRLDPPEPSIPFVDMKPIKGIVLGLFGSPDKGVEPAKATHVLVVNLDIRADKSTTVVGPENLEVFDATSRTWKPTGTARVTLSLPPGGGKLLRRHSAAGGN
jgi:hypothetical protein